MRFFIALACLMWSAFLFSQTGTIRGNVYDKETGEPILFGNVRLEGTNLGSTTDLDGFFTITNAPVGKHNLIATYIGYDSVSVAVTIGDGRITYERILISPSAINLSQVEFEENGDFIPDDQMPGIPGQLARPCA